MQFIDEYYLHCMSTGEFEIFFHVHCTQIHTARDTDMVSGTVCKIREHEKIRENKKNRKQRKTLQQQQEEEEQRSKLFHILALFLE